MNICKSKGFRCHAFHVVFMFINPFATLYPFPFHPALNILATGKTTTPTPLLPTIHPLSTSSSSTPPPLQQIQNLISLPKPLDPPHQRLRSIPLHPPVRARILRCISSDWSELSRLLIVRHVRSRGSRKSDTVKYSQQTPPV